MSHWTVYDWIIAAMLCALGAAVVVSVWAVWLA
jgi:hypothetical protein